MITYKEKIKLLNYYVHRVLLDGKVVGEIRELKGGFQYFPAGHKQGGEVFNTLRLCKNSIESP